jgi:diacylglycerol diphosphate phosphatase/phosphatidate phosphatase
MRTVQLGDRWARTARSHGIQLVQYHKHDWLMILGLVVIEILLNVINPFYRFVGSGMMTDLMYPFKDNTVPFWAVPIFAIIVPIFIFSIHYIRKRDLNDFHHSILGLLFAVLITAVITDSIKDAVGRPRPDFFWRCFPDGKGNYDSVTGNVICHGDRKVIKEGHKSFPSGHTSWSFAGLGYLSLYLAAKINIFDRQGHASKLCIIFFPLLAAALIGISRVDDYWHHWQDVFAGGLIGLTIATLCYRQFFPAPYDSDAVGPYAYFQFLTGEHVNELENIGQDAQQMTSQDVHPDDRPYFTMDRAQVVENRNMTARGNGPFYDLESGRSGAPKDIQSRESI